MKREPQPKRNLRLVGVSTILLSYLTVALSAPSFAQTTGAEFQMPVLDAVDPAIREAIEERRGAVAEAAPENAARAWAELAGALGRYGFAEPALRAAQQAQDLQPEELSWAYLSAVLHSRLGHLDSAAAAFERCLQDPRYGRLATLRLAQNRLDRGDPEAAKELVDSPFGTEVTSKPDVLEAQRLAILGRSELATGNAKAAREALRKALQLAPQATALNYPLALAHRQLGEVDAARLALSRRGEQSITLPDPLLAELDVSTNSAHDLVQRALAASAGGNSGLAFDLYGRALQAAPSNEAALRGRAATAARLGNVTEALETTRRLLQVEPRNPGTHFNHGALLLRANRTSEALAAFLRATELSPEYSEARYNVALLLWDEQRSDEAIQEMARVAYSTAPAPLRADAAEQLLRWLLVNQDPSTLSADRRQQVASAAEALVTNLWAAEAERTDPAGAESREPQVPAWQRALAAADLLRQLGAAEAFERAKEVLLGMQLPPAARQRVISWQR